MSIKELPMQKVMKLIILLMMQTNLIQKNCCSTRGTCKMFISSLSSFKCLSNFWRTLGMPSINCEIELILTWSRNCVITSLERTAITATRRYSSPANVRLEVKDTKLYVPVVTLSKKNDKKLLEQLKSGFKRTNKWNRYRSKLLFSLKITT